MASKLFTLLIYKIFASVQRSLQFLMKTHKGNSVQFQEKHMVDVITQPTVLI
jgi:hypothetical protein